MPLQLCPKCKRFHYVPGECPGTAAGSPSGKAPGFGPGTAGSSPAPAAKQQVVSRLKGEKPIVGPAKDGPAKKGGGRKLSVSTPAATGIELGDSAPSVRPTSPKSTAAGTDRPGTDGKDRVSRSPGRTPRKSEVAPPAADQAEPVAAKAKQPVDTLKQAEAAAAHLAQKNKGGRPRIHPDRKLYKAQKERERRAKLKEAGK